jgi:hypothetical protein
MTSHGSSGTKSRPTTPTTLPYVILLDFDGTIVGDVEWLSIEHDLVRDIKKRLHGLKINYQPRFLKNDLSKGLIRPHFRSFLQSIKERYSNVEFFIYTASDKAWAQFIIPLVEKQLAVKFHRPIFSRPWCTYKNGAYKKSIEFVREPIYKVLKKKYHLKSPADLKNVILIDNNPDSFIEKKCQLLCPTYDYQLPIDVTRQLQLDLLPKDVAGTIMKEAIDLIHETSLIRRCKKDTMAATNALAPLKCYQCYHKDMSNAFHRACDINCKYENDHYWRSLSQCMLEYDLHKYSPTKYLKLLHKSLKG